MTPPNTPPNSTAPLIPRFAVVLVTFALVGFVGYAVYNRDYKSAVVAMFPIMFVLGADVGGMIRAWRGQPGMMAPPPGTPPEPGPLDKEPAP